MSSNSFIVASLLLLYPRLVEVEHTDSDDPARSRSG